MTPPERSPTMRLSTLRQGPPNAKFKHCCGIVRPAAKKDAAGSPQDVLRIAKQLFAAGQYEAAIAPLTQATRILPDNPALLRRQGAFVASRPSSAAVAHADSDGADGAVAPVARPLDASVPEARALKRNEVSCERMVDDNEHLKPSPDARAIYECQRRGEHDAANVQGCLRSLRCSRPGPLRLR
jgi:hypothetical protein